ncbi:hypothetical protein MTR_5g022460 [Medicago truncatula]|uniref:Uncharacterized protein n=1 Tax=Medicago truncatula TaxID=3880 RepID=G7JXI8_MEDTR|nr:hypothetical protein MTR_5g022460 [Medicago truncatula]
MGSCSQELLNSLHVHSMTRLTNITSQIMLKTKSELVAGTITKRIRMSFLFSLIARVSFPYEDVVLEMYIEDIEDLR